MHIFLKLASANNLCFQISLRLTLTHIYLSNMEQKLCGRDS